jgi:hypothetical protein
MICSSCIYILQQLSFLPKSKQTLNRFAELCLKKICIYLFSVLCYKFMLVYLIIDASIVWIRLKKAIKSRYFIFLFISLRFKRKVSNFRRCLQKLFCVCLRTKFHIIWMKSFSRWYRIKFSFVNDTKCNNCFFSSFYSSFFFSNKNVSFKCYKILLNSNKNLDKIHSFHFISFIFNFLFVFCSFYFLFPCFFFYFWYFFFFLSNVFVYLKIYFFFFAFSYIEKENCNNEKLIKYI